jgi:hypothetical protein
MPNNQSFLKILYDGLVKYENNHINILFNILAYLLLKKQVGNIIISQLYENIYDLNMSTSFISLMKSKYELNVIQLEPVDIEKLVNYKMDDTHISIEDIIITLNLKNIQTSNYINHSIDLIKSSIKDNSSVLIMSSNMGEYNKYINGNIKELHMYDINKENAILSQMELDYNYNSSNMNIIIRCEDYIHQNIINKSYDIILCNFPTGLRNIIHANCCDKIKRLKIRGTKSEPLILQLIMMSLNNNGKACIVVPNTLLNNDSRQHVETRNYLINNFNVTNIVNCDNNLSVLFFEKNGLTKQTTFSQIQNNSIVKLFDVYYDKIAKRNYNLYYEKYININCAISSVSCETKKKLIDIVDIVETINCHCDNDKNKDDCNYIKIPKNFNDNQKVEILFDNCDLDVDNISLKIRDETIVNQKYFNYYFLYKLAPYLITSTTGKSKKLDINILLDTEINIPNMENQNKIVEFFDINYSTINQIKKQITNIEILKNKYIETITNNYPMIKLSELCDVDVKPHINCNNCNILCVQRNSKSAGNTFYYQYNKDESLNTNVYYLNVKTDVCFNLSSLYILLKYNEANLNKLASITNTINLSRTNLQNFEIKNIPINIQETMENKINQFDNMTKSLLLNVDNLINTNIF